MLFTLGIILLPISVLLVQVNDGYLPVILSIFSLSLMLCDGLQEIKDEIRRYNDNQRPTETED